MERMLRRLSTCLACGAGPQVLDDEPGGHTKMRHSKVQSQTSLGSSRIARGEHGPESLYSLPHAIKEDAELNTTGPAAVHQHPLEFDSPHKPAGPSVPQRTSFVVSVDEGRAVLHDEWDAGSFEDHWSMPRSRGHVCTEQVATSNGAAETKTARSSGNSSTAHIGVPDRPEEVARSAPCTAKKVPEAEEKLRETPEERRARIAKEIDEIGKHKQYDLVAVAQAVVGFEKMCYKEVKRQRYNSAIMESVKERPESAAVLLQMKKEDWQSLNNSLPPAARRRHSVM